MKPGLVLLLLVLYGACTPYAADHLLALFEYTPPIARANLDKADALIILGGGSDRNAPEFGGDTVNDFTLTRLRYGARLWRVSRLPVAVSGGNPQGGIAEAVLMQAALRQDFRVPVRWVEARSNTTWENARDCRTLLPKRVRTIVLVTHAWHIPRARYAFEQSGFTVLPAGTGYSWTRTTRWRDFIPSFRAWSTISLAAHEGIGMIWYRCKALAR